MNVTVDFGPFAEELADADRFLFQGDFDASEVACTRILDEVNHLSTQGEYNMPLIRSTVYQRIVVVSFGRGELDNAAEAATRAERFLDEAERFRPEPDQIEVVSNSREHFESIKAQLWEGAAERRQPNTLLFDQTGRFVAEPLMMTAVCEHGCRVVALPCGFIQPHCKIV